MGCLNSNIHSIHRRAIWIDLPIMEYRKALELQRALVNARIDKLIDVNVILALEHPPVYTLGRRGGEDNIVVSKDFLKEKGIETIRVERGGNITYHGPGQLVIYPIIDLKKARIKVVEMVSGMEALMVKLVSYWGIEASGDEKNRGVWAGNEKLGSIGITIKRGISFHGLALNVNMSLEPFAWINPCGLNNITMTSMKRLATHKIPMTDVRKAARLLFAKIFKMKVESRDVNILDKLLAT